MATKHSKSAQTGESGVALIRKIATDAGGIFRGFETADIGIDGAIEFVTPEHEPSGDIVLVQIKAGQSYVKNGRFYVHADRDHFETWVRYAIPVAGIVCDPSTDQARWVDISAYLRDNPDAILSGPFLIEAPSTQAFSVQGFTDFAKHFRRQVVAATQVHVTPNLLIRAWEPTDAKPTRALLSTIASDYPAFDKWLAKKFGDPSASKKVVLVGTIIAAFSMWQAKDNRNIKLQTFIVGPLFRGTAIGQHLLYHELRTWAGQADIERVHVTVASSKSELIGYFRSFGFRVEGFSPRRYPRPAAELVMAKQFLRSTIRTPQELEIFADQVSSEVWGLANNTPARFNVRAEDLAIPVSLPPLAVTLNASPTTVDSRILLQNAAGDVVARYDDESLMREFFPLRLHLARKRYVVVPIYPNWVEAMLSTSGPSTPLKLRVDNAYYCYPKISDLRRGDLVLFYETKMGGGRGAAIGAAVVQEVVVDEPTNLFARFSDLGIYDLSDIQHHQNVRGNSMAIKFSLFESFLRAVSLKSMREVLAQKTTFQGLTPISRDAFELIRSMGLS